MNVLIKLNQPTFDMEDLLSIILVPLAASNMYQVDYQTQLTYILTI